MGKQGSKVSRIRRETHAIQPKHTLTRHTSYFSRREITRIAPTNLRHYLTVEQVGIKWVPLTKGDQTSSFARTCPLFETLTKNNGSGRYFTIFILILLKPHTCSHCICVAFLWVVHKLVSLRPPLLGSVRFALVEVSRGSG